MAESTLKVVMKTNRGEIIIELNPEKSPITVANFLRYVNEEFFDGTIFHRVIPGFMIQGGGFLPDMTQKSTHSPIVNEASNMLKNDYGTIAMARTQDPHSATAQFFINVKDNDFLNHTGQDNPGYTVFGKVIQGIDIVEKISKTSTTTYGPYSNVPVETVIIESVRQIDSDQE